MTFCRLRGRHQRIRFRFLYGSNSLRRLRRGNPRCTPVHRRPQGIQIGPRPLFAPSAVLLKRRVAHGNDASHRTGLFTQGLSGSTEVDQHRGAIFPQIDVAGLNVPVKDAFVMDSSQTMQGGDKDRIELIFAEDVMSA